MTTYTSSLVNGPRGTLVLSHINYPIRYELESHQTLPHEAGHYCLNLEYDKNDYDNLSCIIRNCYNEFLLPYYIKPNDIWLLSVKPEIVRIQFLQLRMSQA